MCSRMIVSLFSYLLGFIMFWLFVLVEWSSYIFEMRVGIIVILKGEEFSFVRKLVSLVSDVVFRCWKFILE